MTKPFFVEPNFTLLIVVTTENLMLMRSSCLYKSILPVNLHIILSAGFQHLVTLCIPIQQQPRLLRQQEIILINIVPTATINAKNVKLFTNITMPLHVPLYNVTIELMEGSILIASRT